jgi:hypothetical protein
MAALARPPLPAIRVSDGGMAAAPAVVSERSLQQALLALDADNRVLRRKLADAGALLQSCATVWRAPSGV